MNKYKLISEFDENDTIEFEVPGDDDPCSVALEQLGWILTVSKEDED